MLLTSAMRQVLAPSMGTSADRVADLVASVALAPFRQNRFYIGGTEHECGTTSGNISKTCGSAGA